MKSDISKPSQDLVIIFVVLIISFIIFGYYDVLELIVELSSKYEDYEIDEIFSTMIVFTFCMLIFSMRRLKEVNDSRKKILEINEQLEEAINEIKTLQGIIPICSYCHSIRDDEGAWSQLESYLSKHSEAMFSHGICPKCMTKALADADLSDDT